MEAKEIKIDIPKGYEIDRKNSTFECIKLKKIHQVNTWKDLQEVNGYYINVCSNLSQIDNGATTEDNKNIFISKKYAKAALAIAQISQLMPYYGGEITDEEWNNIEITKYTINVFTNVIQGSYSFTSRNILAFHTLEDRNRFLSFPENIQLVKDLYMVD